LNATQQKSNSCSLCKLLKVKARRFYYECDEFVIFENPSSSSPILIGCKHEAKIPINAFEEMKKVCLKLFACDFCLSASQITSDHYQIKTIRFFK